MAWFRKTTVMAAILAMALLGVGVNSAQAEMVRTDAGATGDFFLTSDGVDIKITFMLPATITDQNGKNLPVPNGAAFGDVSLHIMSHVGSTVTFTPGIFKKTLFPAAGGVVSMDYRLSMGVGVGADDFNFTDVLNIVALNTNGLDGPIPPGSGDYSLFAFGGTHNLILTSTDHTMDTLFDTIIMGGTAEGHGSYSQIAVVPEPATLAVLGIGLPLVGGYLVRRRQKV